MNKSIMKIILGIIAVICMTACQPENMRNDNAEQQQSEAAATVYLSISLNEGRTVMPQLDKSALTWKLVGQWQNSYTGDWEDEKIIGEWSYEDMLSAQVGVSSGWWNFTLTAHNGSQDVLVGNILTQYIYTDNNHLSFTMKECDTGTGTIALTVKVPLKTIAKVEAILRDASDDTLIDTKTFPVTEYSGDATLDYALCELQSVEKGFYSLLIKLYQSESDTQSINDQIMLVRVEPGCISAGTVTFEEVNNYWHIIYHFEDFDMTDDTTIPTEYNRFMTFLTPAIYKPNSAGTGYLIECYDNADRTGDKIRQISYDTSGDIELWIKSKSVCAVSASELSAYLDTLDSDGGPYTITLSDKNPDLSIDKTALTDHPLVKVNLDMTACISMTSIYYWALSDCTGLVGITIPDSVTSIGGEAFNGCSGLTYLNVKAISPPSLGYYAYSGCNSLTAINVLTSSVSLYQTASGWSDYSSIIKGENF